MPSGVVGRPRRGPDGLDQPGPKGGAPPKPEPNTVSTIDPLPAPCTSATRFDPFEADSA